MTSTYGRAVRVISSGLRTVLIALIRIYQHALSPVLGGHCRFEPTCSEYCIEALRKHGVCKGLALGIWRVLRCNPFCKAGYDPVPDAGERTPADDTSAFGL